MADDSGQNTTGPAVAPSVALLGFTACVTQLVLLREFFNVFAGNELTLGLILGNWLFLTGLGGLLARFAPRLRSPLRWAAVAQMAIALAPGLQIAGVRLLKQQFPAGLALGIGEAFVGSLAVLLPFCLVSGFLLAWFSGLVSERRGPEQIGRVYVLDTVGGIAGGLLFGFVLVHLLAPFRIAALLLALNLAAAFLLARAGRHGTLQALACVLLVASLAAFWHLDPERRTAQAMFPGLELLSQRSTPHGSLAVTRAGSQISVFESGVPVGSSNDEAAAEEIVHYALAQHPDPKRVLLVSGGLVGAHREAEKYAVERVDYVELDPAVLDLAAEFAGAGRDPRTRPVAGDARRVVRAAPGAYDAILLALPDPSSAQINRFYTAEFFAEARRALRPGGVLSFSLGGSENYASREVRLLASAVYRSLAEAFPNVLLVPGARQYFVASDRPLGLDIDARLRARGIATRYVNRDHLAAKLTPDRLAAARDMVRLAAAPNRDFRPVSYHAHLRVWLSEFGTGLLPLLLLAGALLVVLGALLASSPRRAVAAAVAASGLAGMGLEVVLLVAFQIGYGYVYQQAALIVTGFMVGAAVGAAWAGRAGGDPARRLFLLDAGLAGTALALVPTLPLLAAADSSFVQSAAPVLYPLLTAACGFLVGAQFPPAARLIFGEVEETAGRLFALDLLGACLGALVVSAFGLPLLGVTATCGVVGGLKLLTAAGLWLRREAAAEERVPAFGAALSVGAMLLVFALVGVTIVNEQTSGGIYALSLEPAYAWWLVFLLALGILRATGPWNLAARFGRVGAAIDRGARAVFESTKVRALRWVYFVSFAVAVFYPIFRCYFRVPYLFCHVCPRKCVFGFVRPYLVPAVLIMNLENRFWCHNACPLGTLQDGEARVCPRSRHAPERFRLFATGVLVFTALAYFKVMWDLDGQPAVAFDWYTFFFNNVFSVSAAVVGTALALLLTAARLRRTFCEALCPVGTFSEWVLRLERWMTAFRRESRG